MPRNGGGLPRLPGGRGGGFGRFGIIGVAIIGALFYWFSNQKEIPFSGRQQFVTVPVTQEVQMGAQAYSQILGQERIVRGTPDARAIEDIGRRLAAAAIELEKELIAKGEMSEPLAERFDWQFALIESEQANAFCLPGGYVAFYTGILPVAQNLDGVAIIMGHEIAHALARHGAERMSLQQMLQLGQIVVSVAVGDMGQSQQQAVLGAFGLGAQVGLQLPFSRTHESEADEIGLELAVRACFDPREAPLLWKRMAELGGGERPPELMSTHPDPERRAQAFEQWMPAAIEAYEQRCGPLPARG
jgi:predicted Zn-dependent protease